MSNALTKSMKKKYEQVAGTSAFFTGMFTVDSGSFYNTSTVQIDITRSEADISVPVTTIESGYRLNSVDVFTNKEFTPPAHKESFPLNVFSALDRVAGDDPFKAPQFRASLASKFLSAAMKVEAKIRRSIELQASQVLQTGTADLKDKNGVTIYTIDYKPKATHFPTTSEAWDGSGGGTPDLVGDILALCKVIRNDFGSDPNVIEMSEENWELAIKDTSFKARFETRRIDVGSFGPMRVRGDGGQFRGTVDIGNYPLEVWTYNGYYKDPQTGAHLDYLTRKSVIVRSTKGRLDASFGAIPRVFPIDRRLAGFIPRRMNSRGLDMFWNAWLTPDGENVYGGVASRPLMIPTAIDSFACLDTDLA